MDFRLSELLKRNKQDVPTGSEFQQQLMKLEIAIWSLVGLMSCTLVALIVAYLWLNVWSEAPHAEVLPLMERE